MAASILPVSNPAVLGFGLGNTQLFPPVLLLPRPCRGPPHHPADHALCAPGAIPPPGLCFAFRSLLCSLRYGRVEGRICSSFDLPSDLIGVNLSLCVAVHHLRGAAALTSAMAMGAKDARAKAEKSSTALQACPMKTGCR